MGRAPALVWWGLLAACVAGIWLMRAVGRDIREAAGPALADEVSARYLVGLAHRPGGERGARKLLENLDREARTPRAELRLVPVAGEIHGAEEARDRLGRLRTADLDPRDRADVDLLDDVYAGRELTDPDREALVRRHGWLGRLALAHGLPDRDPARRDVLRAATRTILAFVAAGAGALVALLAGIALLALGLVGLGKGWIRFVAPKPLRAPGDHVWLQTVVILLAGVIAVPLAQMALGGAAELLIWAFLLVPLWPLARGMPRAEWRRGLGLTGGRGLAREIGAGIVGYLAGMPLFAVAIAASLFLSRLFETPLSHPAVEEATGGGARVLYFYLTACVWAPLVEEACFRGAFQRYLRPRLSRLATMGAVGLLFAAVHPQGLAAIPALAAIGGWLALLREWRGTLVPCVAAHAFHNVVLVSIAVVALGG